MSWTKQYKTPLLVGAALSFGLMACGSDDDTSSDEAMNNPAPSEAPSDPDVEEPSNPTPAEGSEEPTDPATDDPGNIVEVARAAGTFETLLTAATTAGLVEALTGDGPLTVFAPTDEAFDALPDGTLDALLDDPEELAAVLSYHVVAERVPASSVTDGASVDTLLGPWLTVSVEGDDVRIGDARIVATDIAASNGVIHVLDSVLLPPAPLGDLAAETEGLSTLTAAVAAAELGDTLNGEGPFTVFAPTDEAFAALPDGVLDALLEDQEALTSVLLYHVVAGRQRASSVVSLAELETVQGENAEVIVDGDAVRIAGANVIATDIPARNGVVHLLDAVILPPSLDLGTLGIEPAPDGDDPSMEGSEPVGNLLEVAESAGNFTTLLAAIDAAGLQDALSGDGPLTVFAPTDEAFAALGEGAVEDLLQDPDALAEILLFHVVGDSVMASEIEAGTRVDSLLGPWLEAAVDDSGVRISGANVSAVDILASNGVIHVIDSVLLPPPSIAAIAASNPELSTLVTALGEAGLVETLDGDGTFTVFAPTNAAFEALPEGVLDGLLNDPDALREVLLYHVLGVRLSAAQVTLETEVTTLLPAPASVEVDDAGVRVDGANVSATDILAKNGVIHLLDAVMLPPGL